MTTPTYVQHTSTSAPPQSQAALDGLQQALGFVPNLFATLAESPATLNGYLALDGVLAKGTLGGAERQLLLTTVSSENACAYCTAAHSTFAASMRAAPDALAAARDEGAASDPRLQALVDFTRAVIDARGRVAPAALATFLAAGYAPAQALEVVANVGLKTISNYIDGFAHVPLDAAFAPQRWEAGAAAR